MNKARVAEPLPALLASGGTVDRIVTGLDSFRASFYRYVAPNGAQNDFRELANLQRCHSYGVGEKTRNRLAQAGVSRSTGRADGRSAARWVRDPFSGHKMKSGIFNLKRRDALSAGRQKV